MKILFIGDASGYHHTLATALSRLDHDVTVASAGSSFMDTGRDIDISRPFSGKVGGLMLWLRIRDLLSRRFRGYDVVQISNPVFLSLRPHLVRKTFDRLRTQNGIVCLSALGTDTPFIEECLDPVSPLRYNEWRIGDKPGPQVEAHPEIAHAWLTDPLRSHCRHIYDNVDAVISDLYEYHIASRRAVADDRLAYAGIPIAIPDATQHDAPLGRPVRILMPYHSHRLAEKGTDRLIDMCRSIEQDMPDKVRVDYVHDVTYREFASRLDRADIVIDQLYSYTPATTALMAMARGKVTVSGAEPEYYDFIGEDSLRPIINADPLDLDATRRQIMDLVDNPGRIADLGRQSREFAIKHNADNIVAHRFVEQWQKHLK